MSGAAKKGLSSIQRALERWPKDVLRPDCQLQDVLARRLQSSTAAEGLSQARPLLALLDNQYARKYQLSDRIMKPKFNPTYYEGILDELKNAPNRGLLERISKKISGMFRLQ
ncbi:hypothetical protein QBC39DRAFT_364780 [Podospora conica]|nr:hypothetical protein QBC39DRAFT_364780 [Schizothecium conicum]